MFSVLLALILKSSRDATSTEFEIHLGRQDIKPKFVNKACSHPWKRAFPALTRIYDNRGPAMEKRGESRNGGNGTTSVQNERLPRPRLVPCFTVCAVRSVFQGKTRCVIALSRPKVNGNRRQRAERSTYLCSVSVENERDTEEK